MDGAGGRRRTITKTELPPELVVNDILSRLPVKTIGRCRCVSKSWLNLLLDPNFAKVHFSRSPVQFLIQSYTPVNLFLVELDQGSIISRDGDQLFDVIGPKSMIDFKTFTKIHHGSSRVQILNSCNGVLCLVLKSTFPFTFASGKSPIGDWYPFHIYNPVTGEHHVVPQMETDDSSLIPIAGGLGYSGKTNDFKLLRFLQLKNDQENALIIQEADLQTIGSNTWRRIDRSTCRWSRLNFSNSAPFLNGALHWITYGGDEAICSFDFEEEKFGSLATPVHFDGIDLKRAESMGTLGGSLCLCFRAFSGFPLYIWVMSEYGVVESWSKRFVVDNPIHSSIGGTVKMMNNGDILLMGFQGLILCNLRTKTIRLVVYDIIRGSGMAAQIPHVSSFVRVLKQD